jgi:hypothetical protein
LPPGDPHIRQRRKNIVLLLVLLALIALLYGITLMKMSG